MSIPLFKPFIPPRHLLHAAWDAVLDSGYLAEGDTVKEFEKEFSRFTDAWKFTWPRDCIATNSCTAALHLALILAGAGPGTEVISTPMTAEPTNLAVLHTGAKLVWADVNPLNGNIDWGDVLSKITDRTVAVMCVHYGGIPANNYDMWNVPTHIQIIEDCAQAIGARWEARHVGLWGDYGCFSFQAIKTLTTGDGGMLVTRRESDSDRARRLRWFGIDRSAPRTELDITEPGYKYNMNNLTAAMGLTSLRHISPIIAAHISNGEYYEYEIAKVPGINPADHDTWSRPSYWFFTVVLESESDRDSLSGRLTERGIGNGTCHRRNDLHTVFESSRCELPNLDKFYSTMLHIPCGWWVGEEERDTIMEIIREG